jgi:hypothetical protein
MPSKAEIEEAKQAAKDAKDAPKIEEAYNKATVNTPFAPAPKPAPTPPKKMAKGGTASSRADGIAQKGKTRGKMC